MSTKSLKAQKHLFADPAAQIKRLNADDRPRFDARIAELGFAPLRPSAIEILQINMGKMCNQVCKHCHVDAGPDRKEIMTRETLQACLDVLAKHDIGTVDLTGGAPEMNPHFRWFVEEASKLGKHIIDRCNLTIITANKRFNDLPEFFAKHKVEVVSSLPHYTALRTDSQRGDGVFDRSIQGLRMLNEVGYAQPDKPLQLNLVYNPTGAILPGDQALLEADYKRELKRRFAIDFNHLFVITNMPISRFLDYLLVSNNYDAYMQKLIDAYNSAAVSNVMCRTTLSVGWDGRLYDCDFNQMLDLEVKASSTHIASFDAPALANRAIVVNQHCYGCTAGAGSSCGGQVV